MFVSCFVTCFFIDPSRSALARRLAGAAYRISYFVYRISYNLYRISYNVYRISYNVYRITYIVYRICYMLYAICYMLYAILAQASAVSRSLVLSTCAWLVFACLFLLSLLCLAPRLMARVLWHVTSVRTWSWRRPSSANMHARLERCWRKPQCCLKTPGRWFYLFSFSISRRHLRIYKGPAARVSLGGWGKLSGSKSNNNRWQLNAPPPPLLPPPPPLSSTFFHPAQLFTLRENLQF